MTILCDHLEIPASVTPESLARDTVEALGLVGFTARWNNGGGSFIAGWGDFWLGLTFDDALANRYAIAQFKAEALGWGARFEAALRALLEPVIHATFQSGLDHQLETWATSLAGSCPRACNAPAPFMDEADWTAWCLSYFDQPPLCDPIGEELFSPEREDSLMREALSGRRGLATQMGWLARPGGRARGATLH